MITRQIFETASIASDDMLVNLTGSVLPAASFGSGDDDDYADEGEDDELLGDDDFDEIDEEDGFSIEEADELGDDEDAPFEEGEEMEFEEEFDDDEV